MRVFLDANVLFAASKRESSVARLFDLIVEKAEAVTSTYTFHEAERNILNKKQNWIPGFQEIIAQTKIVGHIVFPLKVTLNDKDMPVLCAAIHSRCDYLVTGDHNGFGHLYAQKIDGVTIVSLVQLKDILGASQRP